MVFYKKKGFPAEKEIVLCKVKKILPHSVFVELVEYENLEGMIHISELSSRWTKNIHDEVIINSQIVCRVEKIDEKKGYIDLSRKRVTSGEEKKKKNEVKNENRIEKLIDYACRKNKITLKDFYEKTGFTIVNDYEGLYPFYENYKEDAGVFDDLDLPDQLKDDIKKAFDSLVQNSRVTVKREVKFIGEGSNGLDNLKKFVKELLAKVKKEDNVVEMIYINAPVYLVSINNKNYKEANNLMDEFSEKMKELSKKFSIQVLE